MDKYIYEAIPSKEYKKQLKLLSKDSNDKYNLDELDDVIDKLRCGKTLSYDKYKDHKLKGKFSKQGDRACHIGGKDSDFCLRYRLDKKRMILHLLAAGDHRMVYGTEAASILNYYLSFND